MENLLQNIPTELPEEFVDTLLQAESLRIERIVSRGHTSPATGWYDQDENEWVLLVEGAARLAFDDGPELNLAPGDWLLIPAHRKHRVAWTDPDHDTVWLAIFY